jgi:hypothetical protein
MPTSPTLPAGLPPDSAEVLCTACTRPLHELASRALGLGPVCRRGLRDLAAGTGQLALDLDLPEPSLED